MNRRSKTARLQTGGLIGASTTPLPGDEHWNDVTLLLDGSSPTDDLSNQDASITNTNSVASVSVTGPTGYGTVDALSFNGTNQCLTSNHYSASLYNQDFTIEGWFYIDTSASTALFSHRASVSHADGPQIYTTSGGQFGLVVGGGSSFFIYTATAGSVTVGGWQHLALVRSGNNYTVYKDGQSIITATDSGSNTVTASGLFILMGGYATSSARGQLTAGDVFDFRITEGVARYTAAFTPPTASLPTNAPVVGRRGVGTYDTGDEHWNDVKLLIDGSFTDASTAGNNLTSVGGANVLSMTGPYGTTQGVLNFDGSNDYAVETTASGDFSFGTDDFTIEAWLKADVAAPSGVPGVIDYDYSSASTVQGKNDYFVLHQMSSTRTYAFFANNTSGTVVKLVEASFPNITDFHHVAVTRSGSTVKMFINGVLAATSTNVLVADMTSNRVNPKLFLGYQDLASRYWNGKMADVRITKGVARYTSDFTPPTASLPTVLTGTPEATKTLRTRGYLGAAPVGSGGILTLYDRLVDRGPVWDGLGAEFLLVGGGGTGGIGVGGGGGGGGGMVVGANQTLSTGMAYNIVIGAGGDPGNTGTQENGQNSTFNNLTATGGGRGVQDSNGQSGGSGAGGGSGYGTGNRSGGSSTQAPYSSPAGITVYGYSGGTGPQFSGGYFGGGGGGAGGSGSSGSTGSHRGGPGGAGRQWAVDSQYYAGGGGGGAYLSNNDSGTIASNSGDGGIGGGGHGAIRNRNSSTISATAGTPNTGGGGGGRHDTNNNGGGSGVFKIWVPVANYTSYLVGAELTEAPTQQINYGGTDGTLITITASSGTTTNTITFN